RSHREVERRDVSPPGERADPRPASPEGSRREREVRGGGHPPPKGRRGLPRSTYRSSGVSRREASRLHGDDASPGAATPTVRCGSGAQFAMAGQALESRPSVMTCDTEGMVEGYAAGAGEQVRWRHG